MENRELADDATSGQRDPGEDTSDDSGSDAGEQKLFGLIPMKIAVPVVIGLPVVGFLLGMLGAGAEETTVPVEFVIPAQQASTELQPGSSSQFTIIVENPTDSGVQVTSISAGSSEPTSSGCPAGAVTSQAVEGPPGYIGPNGFHAYLVTATMAPTAGEQCTGQSFTLPLEAELVSAG